MHAYFFAAFSWSVTDGPSGGVYCFQISVRRPPPLPEKPYFVRMTRSLFQQSYVMIFFHIHVPNVNAECCCLLYHAEERSSTPPAKWTYLCEAIIAHQNSSSVVAW